jgi:hypothetical protein
MLRNYKGAIDWRNATGRGVEEAGGTIEAELNRRCSWFAELDAIFGTRPNMNPPATFEPLASGEEPEDAAVVLEDGLLATDETGDHGSITTSGSHRNRRRVSSSASSVQPRRGNQRTVDAASLNVDRRFNIEEKRIEMQAAVQQKQFEMEREERERRFEMEREERNRRFEIQAEIQQRRLEMDREERAAEREERERRFDLEVQKLELEKTLAEERNMMLRLKLAKLEKP